MIPAGLTIGETEFLKYKERMIAIHEGNRTEIDDLPMAVLQMIDIAIDDIQRESLIKWGFIGFHDQIIQFLKCNASAYDFTPDLKDGVFQNEYCKCAFRGKCPYEGKLCRSIKLKNGEHLTMSQLRITSMIRAGLFDKEIAAALGISENTLRVHEQNIRRKLNVSRKAMVAMMAVEIGIA